MHSKTNTLGTMSIVICAVFVLIRNTGAARLLTSPIVLVPGFGGSKIYASESMCKENVQHDPDKLTFWFSDFVKNESQKHLNFVSSSSITGCVPDFGSTESVEFLTNVRRSNDSKYFSRILHDAISWGYEPDRSIKAAPYDFRKSIDNQQEYFLKLQNLIEELHLQNGGQSVIIIAHDLGCVYVLEFLQNQVDQVWKDKYIKAFVAIGGLFGGTVRAIEAVSSGYDLASSQLPASVLRTVQKSWRSVWDCFPRESTLDLPSFEVVASIGERNFTVAELPLLFSTLGQNTSNNYSNDSSDTTTVLNPPGVEVHCIFGTGVSTPYELHWPNSSVSGQEMTPKLLSDKEGDAVVSRRSANPCQFWEPSQFQPVFYEEISGVGHLGLLSDDSVLRYIYELLNLRETEEAVNFTENVGTKPIAMCTTCILLYFATVLITSTFLLYF